MLNIHTDTILVPKREFARVANDEQIERTAKALDKRD